MYIYISGLRPIWLDDTYNRMARHLAGTMIRQSTRICEKRRAEAERPPTDPDPDPPKKKKKTGAEATRDWKIRLKVETPEKYQAFMVAQRMYSQEYRKNLNDERRAESNARAAARMRKLRQKRKEMGTKKTPLLTRNAISAKEEQRAKWREQKQKQKQKEREILSPQQLAQRRRQGNKRRRERYHALKGNSNKKDTDSPVPSTPASRKADEVSPSNEDFLPASHTSAHPPLSSSSDPVPTPPSSVPNSACLLEDSYKALETSSIIPEPGQDQAGTAEETPETASTTLDTNAVIKEADADTLRELIRERDRTICALQKNLTDWRKRAEALELKVQAAEQARRSLNCQLQEKKIECKIYRESICCQSSRLRLKQRIDHLISLHRLRENLQQERTKKVGGRRRTLVPSPSPVLGTSSITTTPEPGHHQGNNQMAHVPDPEDVELAPRSPLREQCCVQSCRDSQTSSAPSSSSSSHRNTFLFPREAARCRQWARACGHLDLTDKTPLQLHSEGVRVCSDHFDSSQFEGSRKRLKPDAMPTIFTPRGAGGRPKAKRPSTAQSHDQENKRCRLDEPTEEEVSEVKVEIDIAEDPVMDCLAAEVPPTEQQCGESADMKTQPQDIKRKPQKEPVKVSSALHRTRPEQRDTKPEPLYFEAHSGDRDSVPPPSETAESLLHSDANSAITSNDIAESEWLHSDANSAIITSSSCLSAAVRQVSNATSVISLSDARDGDGDGYQGWVVSRCDPQSE